MMKMIQICTIQEIYREISDYADERMLGICGDWLQEPYKEDFFVIFANAFYNRYCTPLAKIPRTKTQPPPESFRIDGYLIKNHLRGNWLEKQGITRSTAKERDRFIEELAEAWDAWTYAWLMHPRQLKRKYDRRVVTSRSLEKIATKNAD